MTERARNADFRRKPQIFADSPLLLESQAFGGRRKPQIFAENCRKPQIGLRHLRSVTLTTPLKKRRKKTTKSLETKCMQKGKIMEIPGKCLDLSELETHPNLRNPLEQGEMTQVKHTQICSLTFGQYLPKKGTNTPKFAPSRWGWPPFDLLSTQAGLCKFGWVFRKRNRTPQ